MKKREQTSTSYQQWMLRTANSGPGAFPANGGAAGSGVKDREAGGGGGDDDGGGGARRRSGGDEGDEEAGRVSGIAFCCCLVFQCDSLFASVYVSLLKQRSVCYEEEEGQVRGVMFQLQVVSCCELLFSFSLKERIILSEVHD
jgi:hypothetical protein